MFRTSKPLLLTSMVVCLAGCYPPANVPAGAAVAASIAAIPIIHRSMFDAVWSTVTGKDCSIVRLDRGENYCRPVEPPPAPPPYCTRSLGVVDCWADPQPSPPFPPQVADGPLKLTPAQEEYRTRTWPPL